MSESKLQAIAKEKISKFLKIRDDKGNTLMHYVAKSGDHEFEKKLIAWGCDVDEKNYSVVPLMEQDIVKNDTAKFLKLSDDAGNTLLHHVVKSDDEEFAELLIARGCDVNMKNNSGAPPLLVAISYNQLKMVKILLKSGANFKNEFFTLARGPLHTAAFYGFPQIVQFLIDAGADVDALDSCEQRTALHFASWHWFAKTSDEYLQTMKILIHAGADINYTDHNCWPPLLDAIVYQFHAGIELLLDMGAVIRNEKNADLHYLHEVISVDNDLNVVEQLVKLGGDIHELDESGSSCLYTAISMQKHEIIEFLLNKGARIDIVNDEGLDPLCYGLKWWPDFFGPYDSVNDNHDMDIEKDECYVPCMKCFDLLIKHGANVNYVTNNGKTPLYIVLDNYKHMHSNFVRILLKHGATLDFDHPSVRNVLDNSKGSKFPHLLLRHAAVFEEVQDRTDGPVNFNVEKLNKKSRKVFARCRAELQFMRSKEIKGTDVTFFKLLVNQDIAPYARNERVVRAFNVKFVSKNFPVYGDLIIERFIREKEFQKLVKAAQKSLARVMNWDRNSLIEPLAKIVSYLDRNDVTNLSLI